MRKRITMTSAGDDSPDSREPSRRRPTAVRVIAVVGLACLLALALQTVLPGRTVALWLLATALAEQSLTLVVAGVVLVAVVVARTRGADPGGLRTPALGVAAALLLAGGIPAASSWHAAREAGIPVSWTSYLAGTSLASSTGPDADVALGRAGGTELRGDLWLPGTPAPPSGRPVVLLLHGGSWESGGRGESPRWNEWLTAGGAAVLDVDYRLTPDADWRAMSGDVGCALARVRTLAAEYRLDPRRVVVMGSSAGGHLGLLAGYSPTVSSCGGDAVRPAAIVALYPPADLTSLARADGWRYPEVVPDNTLHELMRSGPDTAPEAWREASPVTHVRAGAPPTLLLHGTHDQIVPVEQSRELERAGRTRGADIGLVELPFANHSYDLVWGGVNAQLGRGELARFLERTVGVRPPTG